MLSCKCNNCLANEVNQMWQLVNQALSVFFLEYRRLYQSYLKHQTRPVRWNNTFFSLSMKTCIECQQNVSFVEYHHRDIITLIGFTTSQNCTSPSGLLVGVSDQLYSLLSLWQLRSSVPLFVFKITRRLVCVVKGIEMVMWSSWWISKLL